MKICRVCKLEKPTTDFYNKRDAKDGFMSLCKGCNTLKLFEWSKKFPEKFGARQKRNDKKRYKYKKEHVLAKNNKWKNNNIQAYKKIRKKAQAKYQSKNKHKLAAAESKRRALKIKASPKWLSKNHLILIKMYYMLASYMTEVTGIKHQVDHIIPLKGKHITGLHVPWNLRVITAEENLRKGNKV